MRTVDTCARHRIIQLPLCLDSQNFHPPRRPLGQFNYSTAGLPTSDAPNAHATLVPVSFSKASHPLLLAPCLLQSRSLPVKPLCWLGRINCIVLLQFLLFKFEHQSRPLSRCSVPVTKSTVRPLFCVIWLGLLLPVWPEFNHRDAIPLLRPRYLVYFIFFFATAAICGEPPRRLGRDPGRVE